MLNQEGLEREMILLTFVFSFDYWSIGLLVDCQMSNVNKVKLLSERTSGVPPVIFYLF